MGRASALHRIHTYNSPLGTYQKRYKCLKKPASLLALPMVKALNNLSVILCGRLKAKLSSLFIAVVVQSGEKLAKSEQIHSLD